MFTKLVQVKKKKRKGKPGLLQNFFAALTIEWHKLKFMWKQKNIRVIPQYVLLEGIQANLLAHDILMSITSRKLTFKKNHVQSLLREKYKETSFTFAHIMQKRLMVYNPRIYALIASTVLKINYQNDGTMNSDCYNNTVSYFHFYAYILLTLKLTGGHQFMMIVRLKTNSTEK